MPVSLFERRRKMGQVFKADLQINIRRRFVFFLDQVIGVLQAFFLEPAAGRFVEDFFKVPFKGGQAPARHPGKRCERNVEDEVFTHEIFQIDLARFGEMKQGMVQWQIQLPDQQDRLVGFDIAYFPAQRYARIEVKAKRVKQAVHERRGRKLFHPAELFGMACRIGLDAFALCVVLKKRFSDENTEGFEGFAVFVRKLRELGQRVSPDERGVSRGEGMNRVRLMHAKPSRKNVDQDMGRHKLLFLHHSAGANRAEYALTF